MNLPEDLRFVLYLAILFQVVITLLLIYHIHEHARKKPIKRSNPGDPAKTEEKKERPKWF